MPFATSLVTRLGDLYLQNLIVTMPMYVIVNRLSLISICPFNMNFNLNILILYFIQVLGHVCYHILAAGLNGYMATLTNLKNPVNKWRCGAAPIAVGFSSFHALFIQFNQLHNIVIIIRFLFLIDAIYVW